MNRRYAAVVWWFIALAIGTTACRGSKETASTPKSGAFRDAPVIIISIDTLRADHLPAYGYRQVETPAIDRFRRDTILFENAYSEVPLTLPSHVALLTGTLPPDNGVRNNIGYPFDAAQHETIPSLLRKHGYATGAAVSAYVLRGGTGLKSAFDFYEDRIEYRGGEAQGDLQRSGNVTAGIAESWIAQQGDRPFFFLLHLYEPHAPYTPPEPYRSRFALPYDGEIAAADAIVGQFLDFLKSKKIYDRAVIVLLSDHGEGLGEHGEQEHGIFLYREDLHVPLMLKLPGSASAGRSVKSPAALIDIFPTIAALTGIKPPELRGVPLLELDNQPPRSLYAESLYPRIHLGLSELRSLIDDRHHFIRAPRQELYDFANDPSEQKNLVDEERRIAAAMREKLDAYGSEMQAPARIDPEEAKKLAALGYLTSTTTAGSGPLPDPKDHIGLMSMLADAARSDAAGDHAAAIAGIQAVLQKNPAFTDAWMLLAKDQEKAGRYEDAIESYKRAIQLAPSLAGDNALSIAALDLNLKRYDDAEKHARLAEKSNPADAGVILGRIALVRHDLAGAESKARQALAEQPDNARAKVFLGQVLVESRRYDEALRLLDEMAHEHAGKQPVALLDYVRGDLLARTNRVDEAIVAFRSEIRNFPAEQQTYGNLAVILYLSGRKEEARQTMEALLQAVPGRGSARFATETFDQIGARDLASEFRRR